MATRRGFLGLLTGFAGGTALATYTSIPDEYLPPREALPPEIRPPETVTESTTETTGGTPTTTEFPEDVRERAREVGLATRDAVVYLELRAGNRYSVGTGWILDDTHIVTNGHVVAQGGEVTCYTADGDTLDVELVEASQRPDVALLRTTDDVPATLSTGSAEDLDRNQPLVQVGHPGSVGNWVISLGTFTGRTGVLGTGDTLKTSVPSAQGSSGSPLVTLDGDVVGLTYASTIERGRFPGSAPEPTDDRVRESFRTNSAALHVPIERVESLVAEWS
ncbi:serine protease Do [Halogranum rubrum]|uniref:Serine protease Do n=1 Tax=Halogranum rubrum TaxID=553466 RepID=A0A1I4EPH3_9EURY|nr:serine protease [Halogranum rubrum]SFL06061.1 serine protease Do [Halogranum rubrum]